MKLVAAALQRPITVLVVMVALVVGAVLALQRMSRDVFPGLSQPVIYVVQPYGGMAPTDMEGQLIGFYEYNFLYLDGIDRIESTSIQGMGFLRLYFHDGTDVGAAMAQVTALAERSLANMPNGTRPPFIIRFDTGTIPIAQLVFSSPSKSESEIQDLALYRVRPLLATLPGVSAPPPFGGKVRMIVAYLDPDRLRAHRLTTDDVATAIARANTTLPSGNVRVGDQTRIVKTNAMVASPRELDDLPIRSEAGAVRLGDLGQLEDGADIVYDVALIDGRRTVYMPITKHADASTLDVLASVRAALPRMRAALPDDVHVDLQFDQSRQVKDAIWGLTTEGLIGALLTALTVLLFLRDPRSALIVTITIPLSVLAALICLYLTGQTINLMTLSGLALAIGILVDEATVAVENIHTHLARGKPPGRAVLDAMREVMLPQLVAMLCILAVLIPALFMVGIGKALFPPLALAVGFSMIASFLLSSTVVPVMAARMLRAHPRHQVRPGGGARLQLTYHRFVTWLVRRRRVAWLAYLALCLPAALVSTRLGTELFPRGNPNQFQLRIRAPAGTRLERTEEIVKAVDRELRDDLGQGTVALTLANIGSAPWSYPVNALYVFNSGPHEAVLLVALDPHAHRPDLDTLEEALRGKLRAKFPDVAFSFEPGDVVSQVLAFGAAAPIEVTVSGHDLAEIAGHAHKIERALAKLPELRDVQVPQALEYPTLDVAVDRERAGELGLTTERVVRGVIDATSSSALTTPIFWTDPQSGVPYRVAVRVPENELASDDDLLRLPVMKNDNTSRALLRDVATVQEGTTPGEVDRINGQRTVSVTANVRGDDLGRATAAVERALREVGAPPRGVSVQVRGQADLMRSTLQSLRGGLVLAALAVLLLLAATFQSLREPMMVMLILPAVLAGVVLALGATGTTLNVQSMMGAIMSIGVSVANAVLLLSMAAQRRREGDDPVAAAIVAAHGRVRPIIMTALAMIVGMLPTALGIGEGAAQSAPLGRAVIGGLATSTFATLVFLPAIYVSVSGRRLRLTSLHPDDRGEPVADPSEVST